MSYGELCLGCDDSYFYLVSCWYGCNGILFFVKQKTAYEMRISDWSSDVCSSDLLLNYLLLLAIASLAKVAVTHLSLGIDEVVGWPEIGSASCRERGCQSV